MWLIEPTIQADLHLDTALVILDTALRWGDIGQIEAAAGFSRGYLSRHIKRMRDWGELPSPPIAERIAQALPLPPEQQADLKEQLLLADELRAGVEGLIHGMIVANEREWLAREAIGELIRVHRIAARSKTPQEAFTYYRALQYLGLSLARAFQRTDDMSAYGLAAAQTHILLHDVLSVLNRPGAALYQAKVARFVLDSVPEYEKRNGLHFTTYRAVEAWPWQEDEIAHHIDFFDLEVNAIRSEAVSLNALGRHDQASVLCSLALETEAVKRRPAFWYSNILRDKVSSMGRVPREGIDSIERYAIWGREVCERHDDDIGVFLIHNALARGYLLRGHDDQTEVILNQESDRMDAIPAVGQLHRAMVLNNLATLNRHRGDDDAWRANTTQALSIARQAGLTRMVRRVNQEQGNHPGYVNLVREITEDG